MILTTKVTTMNSIHVAFHTCLLGDEDEDSDQMENERTYNPHHTSVDSLSKYQKYDLA